ncbi:MULTISPECIES: hypothetical protein [unclassified Acinetobacter]|uniref:hypothetical protein n=1 Tax=unclassified Acinetobacter TaxID=196816 RepID=UPI001F4B2B1E|nr:MULTISPECIES: hypothetical protein [unclassified Acinetobacter]MCH7350407.1 hypothetical protein [Acinetobacter sp. NIPH 2023]MCH7357953.1 hypothetical protein [Acinetobacter sp. NIPH 2024]
MKTFNTLLISFISPLVIGCTNHNSVKTDIFVSSNRGNLHFSFPKDKKVLVYHYEINDYENFESDGITYKRLFISEEINKKMKEIILENYKSNKIVENHAYYMLLGEQGLNKTGVGFTTVGFCLYKDKIFTKQKSENIPTFIQKCHDL